MASNNVKGNPEQDSKAKRESGDDSEEDESEVLEESPCGRWLKRREEVQQRDIPGIDAAYLAMDTEEGVEVVWNEVKFSERKNFKAQEEKIREVFDSLTQLEHPNIVKLHKYWMDKDTDKPRVIFITEYMSSGSLKQFLKKTKRNVIKLPVQAWKRWCSQILSALSYLHSCSPPIIHGNLTCDTIFIQHNGLIKIGSVAPDAIHHHVKTCREDIMNVHFIAPEYGSKTFSMVTPAVDIYSFGMCALEMAALEIAGNGDSGNQITEEVVDKTIESLENPLQKDFIRRCLKKNPSDRPTARELLFHPVIFEVHTLKLLAAHIIVTTASYQPDQLTDEALRSRYNQSDILASIPVQGGKPGGTVSRVDAPKLELEKFLDDVRNGIYPLTSFAATHRPVVRPRASSPEMPESVKSASPEPSDLETRRIINMMCNIKPQEEGQNLMNCAAYPGIGSDLKLPQKNPVSCCYQSNPMTILECSFSESYLKMTVLLRMDDKMNRQLSCEVNLQDTPFALAEELVFHGLINKEDRDMVATLIGDTLSRRHIPTLPNVVQLQTAT